MKNQGYYSQKLSANRLRKCYDVAPPRVQQYLTAEIDFVDRFVKEAGAVLELGCGYGRVLEPLSKRAGLIVGIDSSIDSLILAREITGGLPHCHLVAMDAGSLAFEADAFDVVVCIQNGISAFKVDGRRLIEEVIRVTRTRGTVLFSSYAESFWEDRLEWFRLQSKHGLLGEIDEEATGGGVIVCKDGFHAKTVGSNDFRELARGVGSDVTFTEVDRSSLFCVITV